MYKISDEKWSYLVYWWNKIYKGMISNENVMRCTARYTDRCYLGAMTKI